MRIPLIVAICLWSGAWHVREDNAKLMAERLLGFAVAALLVAGGILALSHMTPIKPPPPEPKTAPITVFEILY